MRLALALVLALAVYAAAKCNSNCVCSDEAGNTWDLSFITEELTGTDSRGYAYQMKMCGITSATSCSGKSAAICQWEQAYPTSGYSLGKFDDSQPTVSLVDSGNPGRGPKLSFTNGDTCWTYQGQIQRTVHVNVECGQAYTGKIDVTEDTNTCTFTVTLPAQGKCKVPGGGSDGKGLSGGSVFLIIFFVSAFLYVTIGCIYKRKKQGTTGIEACPNIDFWRELPGLVKDGIKCTLSGFKRGGGSYETV